MKNVILALFLFAAAIHAKAENWPQDWMKFEFVGTKQTIDALRDNFSKVKLALYPSGDVAPENAECFQNDPQEDPKLVVLLCYPKASIYSKVTAAFGPAYVQKEGTNLTDITMTTMAATLNCSLKKCGVPISQTHTSQTPCWPAIPRGYNTAVCTHQGLPNAAHICY